MYSILVDGLASLFACWALLWLETVVHEASHGLVAWRLGRRGIRIHVGRPVRGMSKFTQVQIGTSLTLGMSPCWGFTSYTQSTSSQATQRAKEQLYLAVAGLLGSFLVMVGAGLVALQPLVSAPIQAGLQGGVAVSLVLFGLNCNINSPAPTDGKRAFRALQALRQG